MKQNAQTNQTKPTNKSNEIQTNPQPKAHMQHYRERDCKRKRECERERERGSDLWWLTERFETGAVVIGSRSDGGGVVLRVRVCLRVQRREWSIWALVERSELKVRVFLLLRVSFSRVWCLRFSLFFYLFIYTKLRATFYKTQLRMNWRNPAL